MGIKDNKVFKWLDERYGIAPMVDFLGKKDIPLGVSNMDEMKGKLSLPDYLHVLVHRHYIWYYFGGITLFFFICLLLTGMLLLFHYKPGGDTSWESVYFLMSEVPFGWLIRSIHSWAANLMLLAAFIHMFSVLFTKSYRKPRELTWLTGFFLLLLAMGAGFSGYLLQWSELSLFAVKIGAATMKAIPPIPVPLSETFTGKMILLDVGNYLYGVMAGGNEIGNATLYRFFAFHVAMIPLGLIGLISFHLTLIQRQGMSDPIHMEEEKAMLKTKTNIEPKYSSMKFFPNFLLRDFVVWMVVLLILIALAVFVPWHLGDKADPLGSAPPNIKPEWFFLSVFVILEVVQPAVFKTMLGMSDALAGMTDPFPWLNNALLSMGIVNVLGLAWMTVPFWDVKSRKGKQSNFVFWFSIALFVGFVSLTLIGHFTPTEEMSKRVEMHYTPKSIVAEKFNDDILTKVEDPADKKFLTSLYSKEADLTLKEYYNEVEFNTLLKDELGTIGKDLELKLAGDNNSIQVEKTVPLKDFKKLQKIGFTKEVNGEKYDLEIQKVISTNKFKVVQITKGSLTDEEKHRLAEVFGKAGFNPNKIYVKDNFIDYPIIPIIAMIGLFAFMAIWAYYVFNRLVLRRSEK